jgi:hypothetical protein
MTGTVQASGNHPSRDQRLAKQFKKEKFRKSYFARQLKVFLAAQIRALRGDRTQAQFGELIGKPQSVVARLERESYGKVNLQTLIDIAMKLDIALIVRFVSFPTFLEWTKDYSTDALAPESYEKERTENQVEAELVSSLHGVGLTSNTEPELFFGKIVTDVPFQHSAVQNIQMRLHEDPQVFIHRRNSERSRSIEQVMQRVQEQPMLNEQAM